MNFPPILFNNEKFPTLLTQNHSQTSSTILSFQNLCKKLLKYENKESNFEQSIISWLKSLDISQLFKYFSFKNPWLVDILHEMVLINNSKPYMKFKFIPGPGFQSPSEDKEPQDTKPLISYINFLYLNKESPKFSDYFNIIDEDTVMLCRGKSEGEQRRQELVDSIRYVTLNSGNINYKEDEKNFYSEYNNVVTLSYHYLKNIDNLITTFQIISNKSCFKYPIEIETEEYTTDNNNTTSTKNYFNFKMPKWLKKEFTFSELLCAYMEQSIIINFMYYKMYKTEISMLYYEKFDELIEDNKKLIEFIKNSGDKKFEIIRNLRPDEIKKKISENLYIKQLICDKKSKDNDIRNSYIGKYSFSKKHTIKTIINSCITTLEKVFIRGEIDFVLFLNFFKDNIIFTTDDFAIKIIADNINTFWKNKASEDLLKTNNNENNNNNQGNNKKKKKKRRKKKGKNENNNDENDNNTNINNIESDIKDCDTKSENNDNNNDINKQNIEEEKINIENKNEIEINEIGNIDNKEEIEDHKEENNLDNNDKVNNEENKLENNINENSNIQENTNEKDIIENNTKEIINETSTTTNDVNNINDLNTNNCNIIKNEKPNKKKKEKEFFLYPTIKDSNKKKKNKQKNKKNSTQNFNEKNNNTNISQNNNIINLNQEDDRDDLSTDKATTNQEEEDKKIEEENKNEIQNEIQNEIINDEIYNENDNNIKEDNIKEKEKEKNKYKKGKSEFEYTSSKQKNKFNMGIKLKKIMKDNSNLIIPKNFHPRDNNYKKQIYNIYKSQSEEINSNDIEIDINSDQNNFLMGSNFPHFTSFNFQSKKKRNYRNKHSNNNLNNNNIFPYNNFVPKNIMELSKEIVDNTLKVNKNKKILQQIREKFIKKIYEIINIILRNSKIEFQCSFYGSSVSGLSIENSDIDIMVKLRKNYEGKDYIIKIMNILVEHLKKSGLNYLINITPISSASVPVIKLDCDLCNDTSFFNEINSLINKCNISYNDISKLFFDITFFEIENELEKIPSELMVDYIKECTLLYPQIYDIIYIMKRFLFNRKLNKSYQGGISSYSLFLMTLAFIKSYKNNYDIPIGSLFLEYLYFYSNFNYYNTLIQPSKEDNNIFENIAENNLQKYNLNIIDPITGLNVAKSTFKIDQIQTAFREGFDKITSKLFEMNLNILGNIQENKKFLDNFFSVN